MNLSEEITTIRTKNAELKDSIQEVKTNLDIVTTDFNKEKKGTLEIKNELVNALKMHEKEVTMRLN